MSVRCVSSTKTVNNARAGSVHVSHAIVEVPCVNVVIGVVLGELVVSSHLFS